MDRVCLDSLLYIAGVVGKLEHRARLLVTHGPRLVLTPASRLVGLH